MVNERKQHSIKNRWATQEIDSEKTWGHLRRCWRSVVKSELAKLLKGETELRDIVYYPDKLAS